MGVATTPSAGQDKPPPTPCPPRMAVPNSSPPATTAALVQAGISVIGSTPLLPQPAVKQSASAPDREESDDEEEDEYDAGGEAANFLAINLSRLHTGEVAQSELLRLNTGESSSALEGVEESDSQQVISAVNTLSLHLQRAKPNEWNELIQVVLQGLMLARDQKK